MKRILDYCRKVNDMIIPLIEDLLSQCPEPLASASKYLILAGGKRLRPTLLLLAVRVSGGDVEKAIPAAVSIELLHNFTLIHDDVMDRDEMRRGVPTVHKIWGEPMAILAGDYLFSKAYEALLKLVENGIDYGSVVEATRVLTWAASTVAEGQSFDIEFQERDEVDEREYIELVWRKTAALFIASLKIGGIVSKASSETISLLEEYGYNMGIAFQIYDDILGVIADEKKLGKPLYSDIREGKKTIIVIHALSKANAEDREILLSALGKRDATIRELASAVEVLRRTGSIDYARRKATYYAKNAISKLNKIKSHDEEALEMLRELALFVVEREF